MELSDFYIEEPTVIDAEDLDALADAKALRESMRGLGTDEAAIIEILTQRSNSQRQEIAEAYKHEYGRDLGDGKKKYKDLVEDLQAELGGNFEAVIVGLMTPTAAYCAKEVHNAISGAGTSEDVLVEMLLARSYVEVQSIVGAYSELFGEWLEDAVKGDTTGSFQRLLVMSINGVRDDEEIDVEKAHEQAESLYNAGEGTWGSDEETFVNLLGHLSLKQLYLVFEEYKKISGRTIVQALEDEFSGSLLSALVAVVKSVHNRPRYFAEKLHLAMDGMGTSDATLVRIIVSRCEIDLGSIKKEYERDYGVTLLSSIQNEIAGDYGRAIVALIGGA